MSGFAGGSSAFAGSGMVELRQQAVELATSEALPGSTPDLAVFNLADGPILTPDYPAEVGMTFAITSVCFPNTIFAVHPFNETFFVLRGTGGSRQALPIKLPRTNFKALSGLASTVQALLIAATLVTWSVTALPETNTLKFTLPSTTTDTFAFSFTPQYVNGVLTDPQTSACKILGFKQTDVPTFSAASGALTRTSSQPCQASGPGLVYIACDLFDIDSQALDMFSNTRRGTVIGKLQLTDDPYTVSTYQDTTCTFQVRLPPVSINEITVFLINEERQAVGQQLDWSMSGIVKYYGASPFPELYNRLNRLEDLATYILLALQNMHRDQKKLAKLKAQAATAYEEFQGHALEG